jgi:hypothetical protein
MRVQEPLHPLICAAWGAHTGTKPPHAVRALVPFALLYLAAGLCLAQEITEVQRDAALRAAVPMGRPPKVETPAPAPAPAPAPLPQLDLFAVVAPSTPPPLVSLFVSMGELERSAAVHRVCNGREISFPRLTSIRDALYHAIASGWIAWPAHEPGTGQGIRIAPISPEAAIHGQIQLTDEPSHTAFLSLVRLKMGTCSVEVDSKTLDLHGAHIPSTAGARAVSAGWGCVPSVRDGLPGLLFSPPLEGWPTPTPSNITNIPIHSNHPIVGIEVETDDDGGYGLARVKVFVDGQMVVDGGIGGEPEDNNIVRKYAWIPHAFEGLAIACGASVLRVNTRTDDEIVATPTEELPNPTPTFPRTFLDEQPEPVEETPIVEPVKAESTMHKTTSKKPTKAKGGKRAKS